jgi:hypothetical protein
MRPIQSATLAVILGLGLIAAAPNASHAQVSIGVNVGYAPPPLPIYEQPPIPGYGYLWTPGYWAWDDYDGDYYWVPGTWVLPPRIGYLWTPGYWDFVDGYYVFNDGYWGPEVGFYGGINYGFGYFGYGYEGGYWRGRDFFYNRSVNNVRNVSGANVFSRPMVNNGGLSRTSFHGGAAGVRMAPTAQQLAVSRQPRLAATGAQIQHGQLAGRDPSLRAGFNHGAPSVAATARPGAFRGAGAVRAARGSATFGGPPAQFRQSGGVQPGLGAPSAARLRQGLTAQPNSRATGAPSRQAPFRQAQPSFARQAPFRAPQRGPQTFSPPPRQVFSAPRPQFQARGPAPQARAVPAPRAAPAARAAPQGQAKGNDKRHP